MGAGVLALPALLAMMFWLPQVGKRQGTPYVAYRVRAACCAIRWPGK